MASFNLGCVKGIKGDTGPKGEKGDKGDTGQRGVNGTDGITPVFSVEKVETLDSSCDAGVEINTSDPSQPKLSFYIPRGADGKDGLGDMKKGIYDAEGLGCDVYEYARELFKKTLNLNGGTMLGTLVANQTDVNENCVRNISFRKELPDSAANGELCFVLHNETATKLSDCEVGTVLLIDEGANKVQYVVAEKDYYSKGSVTLVRKHLTSQDHCFDRQSRIKYSCSDIDIYMESVFFGLFPKNVRDYIISCKIDSRNSRRCFLPSKKELNEMNYFVENGKQAYLTGETICYPYMTRDLNDSYSVITVNPDGEFSSQKQNEEQRIRPMLTLSGAIRVTNGVHNNQAVMLIMEKPYSLYYSEEGTWKEIDA